jgi:hypothetical protein
MSIIIDLTGMRFERLVVQNRDKMSYGEKNSRWICKCDCGNFKSIRGKHLKDGLIKSCGCLCKEVSAEHCKKLSTHNMSYTRLYGIYHGMKQRCYLKTDANYCLYGGRGIVICDEWKNDFMCFRNWAIANGYTDKLSVDRINVNGNYEPSNCRWATCKVQSNNKTNNRFLTLNNQTKTFSEWCEIFEMPTSTLSNRLKRGWTFERAITQSVRERI